MTDRPIDELLRSLPERVEPDPSFAASMRNAVAAELERAADGTADLAQEAPVMTLTTTPETTTPGSPSPRFDPRLVAAAAALVVALVLAAIFAVQTGDEAGIADDSGDVVSEDASYADGTLDSMSVERPSPYRVTTTDGAVWTASLEGDLVKRDAETLESLVETKISNSSVIAGRGDTLWVADAVEGDVIRIDASTGDVEATIPTGVAVNEGTYREGRSGMAFGVEGRYSKLGWIAATSGAVWASDLDGRLLRIDPETNTIVDDIAVGIEGHFIEADRSHVLLGDQARQQVQVLDAESGEVVVDVDGFDQLVGAALHGGRVYIFDSRDPSGGSYSADAEVTAVDLATGERSTSGPIGTVRRSAPDQPIFAPGLVAGAAGVVVPLDKEIVVLDPESLEVLDRRDAASRAGSADIGQDGTVWVAVVADSVVHRFRP